MRRACVACRIPACGVPQPPDPSGAQADIEYHSGNGMTPLMEAASAKRDSEQHEETVKVLLENGAVRQTHVSELMFQSSKLRFGAFQSAAGLH